MNKIVGIIESPTAPDRTNVLWVNKGVLNYFKNGHWSPLGEGEDGIREIETKLDSLDKEMGEVKNDLIKFGSTQGVVELQIGNSEAVKKHNLAVLKSVQSTDHTFFVDIDYGYGTGQWLPTTGGKASIFTSDAHMVCYTIDIEGAVTKASESSIGGNSGGLNVFTVNRSAIVENEYPLSPEEIEVFKKGVDCIRVLETIGEETVATQVYFRENKNKTGYYDSHGWACLSQACDDESAGTSYIGVDVCNVYEGKLVFSSRDNYMIKSARALNTLSNISTSSDTQTICAAINKILQHIRDMNAVWGPDPG